MNVSPSGEPSTSSMSREIYLVRRLESHCLELDSLDTECTAKSPKLVSQRLPRYMRRRAASHNPKRVPKCVQTVIEHKKESTESVKRLALKKKNNNNKKKHINERKRQLNANRRNDKKDRSVLHVWFAKRFKMNMYFNCLTAIKNCTKNERLLYHKSKQDFICHYLSFHNCIQIDYSKSSRLKLIDFLAKFTHLDVGYTFGAKLYESSNREGMTVLYAYESYPFEPLVSVTFLWNHCLSKLWIWSHISVYDKLKQLLMDCSQKHFANQFQVIDKRHQLERFRLIGPKGLQLLTNRLGFDFNEHLKLDELSDNCVHYYRYKDNVTSSLESNDTNLFNQTPESNVKLKTFDFILIVKHRMFANRFTIDLIVASVSAKTLWHKIIDNRGHRVGGLHDLRMIALNTSSLLFPEFGFIDIKENETKMSKLKDLLQIESNESPYVIRNASILSKLSKQLSSNTLNQVLNSIEPKNNALINVEVVCVGRGVPEESDYICIASERELQDVFNKTTTYEVMQSEETNEMTRKLIGLIEFGKYSLETSVGKGLGVITITGLEELIKINEQFNNKYKNKIFTVFKSIKSGLYRTVSIQVIDSVFSV